MGPIIVSASNTLGVSATFLLRNLIRYPLVRQTLKEQPHLLNNDAVIMEFLRRDNHVKSQSRQVFETIDINGLEVQAGESINLFFPGANLDPDHWSSPLELNLQRQFDNAKVFGPGSDGNCWQNRRESSGR